MTSHHPNSLRSGFVATLRDVLRDKGVLMAATPVPRPSARPQQAAPRRQAEAEGLEPVSTGQLCAERCAWSMSRISRRSGSQSG